MKLNWNKNVSLTLALIGTFIFSIWLAQYSLRYSATTPTLPTTPDTFMTQTHYIRFDTNGHWALRFYSPHLQHYPHQNTVLLIKPQLSSQGENKLQWNIHSDKGISEEDGKIMHLTGNVNIERVEPATHKTTILSTTAITIYPKQKLLKTNQPVVITQTGTIIKAVGLTADLNTGEITLLSQAEGVYEPPQ